MEITINGEATQIETADISVADLLALREVESPGMVAVQLNGEILDQEHYSITTVSQGAEVQLLYFMGGGAGSGEM